MQLNGLIRHDEVLQERHLVAKTEQRGVALSCYFNTYVTTSFGLWVASIASLEANTR